MNLNSFRSVRARLVALMSLSIAAFFGIEGAYSLTTQGVTITVTVPSSCAIRIKSGESAAPAAIVIPDANADFVLDGLTDASVTIMEQKCNGNFDIDVASSNNASGSTFNLDDALSAENLPYTLKYGATTVDPAGAIAAATVSVLATEPRTTGWEEQAITISITSSAAEAVPADDYDDVLTFTMTAL